MDDKQYKKTVTACPVCGGNLQVTQLQCRSCGTKLQGEFDHCSYCNLPQDLFDFLGVFVRCEGVIRDIEKEIGLSYPAVKNRIRKLKTALGMEVQRQLSADERTEQVLQAVKDGEMSVKKAVYELRTQGE